MFVGAGVGFLFFGFPAGALVGGVVEFVVGFEVFGAVDDELEGGDFGGVVGFAFGEGDHVDGVVGDEHGAFEARPDVVFVEVVECVSVGEHFVVGGEEVLFCDDRTKSFDGGDLVDVDV